MSRIVVLVGMMGSGKTTVGQRLADQVGARFVDTDHVVVANTGKSVREIFADDGEAVFRHHESAALLDALQSTNDVVIAAAGGSVLDPANRAAIIEHATTTVWLDATTNALNERVRAGEHRPLLDAGSAARLEALRGERQAHYEAVANIRIDTSAMSIDDVVRVIEDHLTREHVS